VTTTSASRQGPLYARLWRTLPRELGYLALGYPIALIGFIVSVGVLSVAAGTLITFFIGVFLLIGALYISRGFGLVEVVRLRWAGRPRIERPEWQDARARQGFWGWLRSLMGNGHYWLYLVHTLVVNPIVSFISWLITVLWISTALAGISFELWWRALPAGNGKQFVSNGLFGLFGVNLTGSARDWVIIPLNIAVGLAMIAVLPFITRGLVWMHWGIARGLLGPFRSDALQREVIALGQSRSAAVSAEGGALRRLERDIHDGPQQRLVRLQMDLAAADRQFDHDPAQARVLVAEAMTQAHEALEELRALSRGFAPPLLLDRGLVAALESLTDRSPLPVKLQNELAPGIDFPQEIERNAYFVAAELLTNAAKHANATEVSLRLATRRIPEPDTTWLDIVVADNGSGGAVAVAGHGLEGLDERLRGLGGVLEIDSPVGGPTVLSAHVPLNY
jgi:signal transduction histidine kinase